MIQSIDKKGVIDFVENRLLLKHYYYYCIFPFRLNHIHKLILILIE